MDPENPVPGATNPGEIMDIDPSPDGEAVTLTAEEHAELLKKAEQFPNVVARAKKAEDELKALRGGTPPAPAPQPQLDKPGLSKDDAELLILGSQGLTDPDLIAELKALAQVRGKGLIETSTDPLFVAIKAEKEKLAKEEKAKLPPSRGSGQPRAQKAINTPGLSDAEHKELWRKENGLA